jgi:hypothetical protein
MTVLPGTPSGEMLDENGILIGLPTRLVAVKIGVTVSRHPTCMSAWVSTLPVTRCVSTMVNVIPSSLRMARTRWPAWR